MAHKVSKMNPDMARPLLDDLPPSAMDTSSNGDGLQIVVNNIKTMNSNIVKLKRMVELLGSDDDSKQLRDNMKRSRQDMSELVKMTKTTLRDTSVPRRQKSRKDKIAGQFQETLRQYEQVSKMSLRKEREIVLELERRISEKRQSMEVLQQNVLEVQQEEMDEVDLRILEETQLGIEEIEADLEILNEAFADVAELVMEQGEDLEATEQNLGRAEGQVDRAAGELQEGAVLQNKSRLKIMLMIVLIIVTLAIIGGVIAIVAFAA
eukprot:TRINITY_DN18_c0_g1_i1.p1 TRINITY_DN18_c0_g1~~TRINITY_DN18_c0_g1_i1.p1  ORF type:complete len:264 (-),score=84.41 TRINITY_DN18_c0_g1_i1:909-1700(-)